MEISQLSPIFKDRYHFRHPIYSIKIQKELSERPNKGLKNQYEHSR